MPELTRRPTLGIVCLPSFENEWSLLVEEGRDGEYTATLRMADQQIWESLETKAPTVSTLSTAVPDHVGRTCLNLWFEQLLRTDYKSPAVDGLDGVSYHFFVSRDQRDLAGSTWSPNPDTVIGRLVEVAHTLHNYVANPSNRKEALRQFTLHVSWLMQSPANRNYIDEHQSLLDSVGKMVGHLNAGVLTPLEVANNFSQQLASSGYPSISPLLAALDKLPETVLKHLKGETEPKE